MRVVGLVVAGVLAACTSADDHTSGPELRRVAILGDSIAFQAAAEIDAALAPIAVRNESAIGRRIEQAMHDARAIIEDDYESVVVILGTNDARGGVTDQDLREVAALAQVLEPARCVQWVQVATDTGDPDFERAEAALNHAIDAAEELDLVSWSPDAAWLRADGIHLTDTGQRELADTIWTSLQRC
jgi:hypothetical protein